MNEQDTTYRSVILAGERPGGSPLSRAFNVSASVMVPVAGKPALARVMQAIENSRQAGVGIICGPSADALATDRELQKLLRHPGFEWLAPASGPAASALSAVEKLGQYPVLLTAGDHALLTADIVDDFCTLAFSAAHPDRGVEGHSPTSDNGGRGYDLVIGFVPYALVKAAWPQSRRTVLKFSNGRYCGSNLFAIMNKEGRKALGFWRQAEADRKHPWRIARRFGIRALLLYLLRRLSLEDALGGLSTAAGCRIGHVEVGFARAAVDVDSIEDQKLAEEILSGE
ncbi:MAG: NTP transferase domain-containing protein [Lysobacterales bacterium]